MSESLTHSQKPPQKSASQPPSRRVVVPQVDVAESDSALRMWVDLPGVAPGGAHINLERESLTLEAEPHALAVPGGAQRVWGSHAPTVFRHAFQLGIAIDAKNVSAVMKDGVLELTLPKAAHSARHRIEVKTD